jgi:uncharacterized protein YkwD
MKIVALIIIVLFTSKIIASDIRYNHLLKLYNSNTDKCLEVSKKYIAKHPEKSVPYYFASKIYLDKFNKSSRLSQKYSLMSRSISYGTKLDKLNDVALESKVDWNTYREEIVAKSVTLISDLNNADFGDKASKLSKQLNRLEYSSPKKETLKDEVAAEGFKMMYYGLPSGNERIKSASPLNEKEILAMINCERKKQGMQELIWEEDLARAARYHAYDLETQKYFDHNSYDRKNGKLIKVGGTFERIHRFYSKSFVNSENIAAGSSTPKGTYTQWYNSPGHYKNMFNRKSEKVGIGIYYDKNSLYGYYWVFCTAQ